MTDADIVVQSDDSLVAYLSRLDKTSQTLIRLFDRGDFYSVHHDNAIFVANDFLKSPQAIKHLGRQNIPTVALSKLNYQALVRELLLAKQYQVELHVKSGMNWKRVAKASPGNLCQFEDILFQHHEMSQTSGVACLYITAKDGAYHIALAYIDVMLKHMLYCEVSDTELFCSLESIFVQVSPKECLLSVKESSSEYQKLKQILQRLGVSVQCQAASAYKHDEGSKYLSRLVAAEDGVSANLASLSNVMSSFCCLVKYLELMSDESNFNQFEVKEISPNSYMRLDSAAFMGLNILPKSATEPTFASLFGILNNCQTPQGKRLLNKWLKQPLLDRNMINERHDIVQAFVDDSQLRQNLAIALKRIPDFYRIAKRIQRGNGKLQDCYRIYMAIKQIPGIIEALSEYNGEYSTTMNCKFLSPLREYEEDFASFTELVETTVDLEKCECGEFIIKPSFDENLADLQDQISSLDEQIEEEFTKLAHLLKAEKGKGLKLECSSTYGHCCRVTRKDEKGVRQNKKFEILVTKKDGVYFTTQHLKSLSNESKSVKSNYEEVQSHIVNEVLKVASGYTDPVIQLNHNIALMDCLLSFAQASVNAPTPYTRPSVLEKGSGIMELCGARHPCLEANEDITYISNNVHLNKAGQSSFLIITGPNMGGKSTYIRMLGVISVMSQIGCFVPCDPGAKISIVSSIFARVGAADSQVKGVSTFMAEMLQTSAILSSADENSLIIIDELGRGTSTYDGFGLAWAISNYIIQHIRCLAVFATHFHEMTNMELVHPETAKNYHVSALVEDDNFTLLYKVARGPCDQSFGVHVARIAHFPENIVKLAEEKAAQLDQFQFIPTECVDSEKHKDFVTSTDLVNSLLNQLDSAYKAGQRGPDLRQCVDTFIESHPDIGNYFPLLVNQ